MPRRIAFAFITLGLFFSLSNRTFAQESAGTPDRVFHSDVDDALTLQKVSVLPFTDNLEGIYARPLEAYFIELIQKMHRWDYVPANSTGPILAPEELEASTAKALQIGKGLGAQGFFACRIVKGPSGITIHLSFFLSEDGKLLLQAVLKEYKQFDLVDLKEQMQRLLSEIVQRIPYSGRVLSRDGNRVTVNLGLKDGLQTGQVISVIQLLKVQRHPKFNFLIKAEKEIFGKIKILKVDDTLSFGMIVTEKEKGAVQKDSKISSLDFVTYNSPDSLSLTPSVADRLEQRDDGKLAFGKNPRAWSPTAPPTFGQVGGLIGLSQFTENAEIGGNVGSLSSNNIASPSVTLDGELWITPEWTFQARLKQGIIPVSNPRSNSSPEKLNQSLSYYQAGFGYMLRLGPHAWSANVEPYLGYFSYRLFIDDSTPRAFTTTQYQGFQLGVKGTTPVGDNGLYGVGGNFNMAVGPGLRESPVSSGDNAKSTVVQFGISGYKKMSERVKLQVELQFEMYSTSFTGTGGRSTNGVAEPASSTSQRLTTLSGGVYYMF